MVEQVVPRCCVEIHDPERGASTLEYVAVILLVSALVGTILVVLPQANNTIVAGVRDAIERILGGGGDGPEGGDGTTTAGDEGTGAPGDPDGSGDSGDGDGSGGSGGSGDDADGGGDSDDGGGCGWNPVCHAGNAVDAVTDWGGDVLDGAGDALGHVGDFFVGVGEGAWGDVVGLYEMFTTNPVDTLQGMWEGIRDDPLSLLISPEAREAWAEGDYGRALGLGAWDVGSWFIPGAGWAAKLGKLGRLGGRGPNAPNNTSRADGNNQPSNTNSEGLPDNNRRDDDNDGNNRRDDDNNQRANACPLGNSFVPGTPVLLADGDYAPIETIRVGDEVWAFDPLTAEEGPREVVNTITGTGEKILVEITVTDTDGTTDTVVATEEHPFWVPELATWVDAIDLTPGSWLRTSNGTWAQVSAIDSWVKSNQQVHNLTIDEIHTYYVLAGDVSVLVHNDEGCMPGAGGTQHTSTTHYRNGQIRLDTENPNPGGRPGQIHIQVERPGGRKDTCQWDFENRRFEDLPSNVADTLRNDPRWQNSLNNALTYLGERPVRPRR